jgi:DNA helicase-2/ATP-dependent DNA helicase PcrA
VCFIKLANINQRFQVKVLLAYLQLIDNSEYNPAFVRAVNVPTRGIGDKVSTLMLMSAIFFLHSYFYKTLIEISSTAEKQNLSMLSLVEKICDNRTPDIKPPVKRKLGNFIKVIQKLKMLASEVNFRPRYDFVSLTIFSRACHRPTFSIGYSS